MKSRILYTKPSITELEVRYAADAAAKKSIFALVVAFAQSRSRCFCVIGKLIFPLQEASCCFRCQRKRNISSERRHRIARNEGFSSQ